MSNRRGFTMIVMLWVMSVAAVIALAGALTGRNAVNAARNRTLLERGYWTAFGCAARVRAVIDSVLIDADTYETAARRWRVIDRLVLPMTFPADDKCDVTLEAAGARLNINLSTADMLDSLFTNVGLARGPAAALAATISDAREARGVIDDTRQLQSVHGLESLSQFDSVLWAEPGRVSLASAGVSVLSAVPGITRETAERLVGLQSDATPVADITDVMGAISRESASALMAHYPEIVRLTTPDPEAWILTVTSSVGSPVNNAAIEWRLLRSAKRVVVGRSRSML